MPPCSRTATASVAGVGRLRVALNLPLRQLLAGVPDERIRAARRAATAASAEFLEGDGHVRFPGHGYYATATRPARRRPDPDGWLPRR